METHVVSSVASASTGTANECANYRQGKHDSSQTCSYYGQYRKCYNLQ